MLPGWLIQIRGLQTFSINGHDIFFLLYSPKVFFHNYSTQLLWSESSPSQYLTE